MNKRIENSLRSNGKSTIAIDLPTRAKLKELAGDIPVSHYVRMLAFGEISAPGATPQEPLLGTERQVSSNTFAAVASQVKVFNEQMRSLAPFMNKPVMDMIVELLAEYRASHPGRIHDKQGSLLQGDMATL